MKNAKWIMIGIGLIVLLAGGGYFGAQMLAKRGAGGETAVANPNTNDGLSGVTLDKSDGLLSGDSSSGQEIKMEMNEAAELPDRAPEVSGFVLEQKDDTFLIGTGEPTISSTMNDDGTETLNTTGTDGPSVEVVITRDTQLFEDVTDLTAIFSGENISSVQQEVKLIDSLDDVATDEASMAVWGTKRGDRIIAEIVVVFLPRYMSVDNNQ